MSDDLDIFLDGPGTLGLVIWDLLFLILLEFDLTSFFFFTSLVDESDASSALFGLSYWTFLSLYSLLGATLTPSVFGLIYAS